MARVKSLHVVGPASGDAEADATESGQFVRLGQLNDVVVPLLALAHAAVAVADTPSLALRLNSGTQELYGFVRRKAALGDFQGAILEDPAAGGIFVRLGTGGNDAARGSDLAGLALTVAGKADAGHTHTMSEIDGLTEALEGKAASNHGHDVATQSIAGFMSDTDKTKLDGLGISTVTKYASTFANGTDSSFIINHGLGTEDVVAQVRKNSGSKDMVECDITVIDGNHVRLEFADAPPSGSRRVTIV